MKWFDIVLDRTQIAEAAENYEVMAWVDNQIRFTDIVDEEEEEEYAVVDDQRYKVACYARDLDEIAPALPKIRVAFCPTTVEAEEIWGDPAIHVVLVNDLAFGPLKADGRSRSTACLTTITREEGRWTISAISLYLALRLFG